MNQLGPIRRSHDRSCTTDPQFSSDGENLAVSHRVLVQSDERQRTIDDVSETPPVSTRPKSQSQWDKLLEVAKRGDHGEAYCTSCGKDK